MELYSYYRSSAAYRVRIALNLKEISCSILPVNLLQAEHQSAGYRSINPQGLVPTLKTGQGHIITQSTAILEWLEETYPDTPLLPEDALERATIRSWCSQIACDIHPVNNLRVLKYLTSDIGVEEAVKNRWYHHWIEEGFAALEAQISAAPYCFGTHVTLADLYLVPQVFNALRFEVPMDPFPKIMQVYESCNQLSAFIDAKPENQIDAP